MWNSIRAVDYLVSLPDVDAGRIGVTGASGGATQGFLLAAVDDRIGYSAPVNMVSFLMQGGSPCENAPLLRVDTHNVELAAAFAPKPQLLVSATGDWTVNTPAEEFPAVQGIYRLLDAEANVEWRQFDSPHNYHRDSREAVYGFFGRHILGDADASRFVERAYSPEQLSSLLYLWGRTLPEGAVDLPGARAAARIAAAEADTAALAVGDAAGAGAGPDCLPRASRAVDSWPRLPRRSRSCPDGTPAGRDVAARPGRSRRPDSRRSFVDEESGRRRRSGGQVRTAGTGGGAGLGSDADVPTLLVHPDGAEAAERSELGRTLAARGAPLLLIDTFQTGAAMAERDIANAGRNAEAYYHVFNRSDDANRVQDVLTAIAFLRRHTGAETINVVGTGRAGRWVLLAAALDPGELTVAADLDRFDASDDEAYVNGLFIPGLRRAPNVAGWAGGRTWVTPATLLQRGNLFRGVLYPDTDGFWAPDRVVPGIYRQVEERLAQGMNITAATQQGDAESSRLVDRDEDYNTRYGGYMGYVMAFERLHPISRAGWRIWTSCGFCPDAGRGGSRRHRRITWSAASCVSSSAASIEPRWSTFCATR